MDCPPLACNNPSIQLENGSNANRYTCITSLLAAIDTVIMCGNPNMLQEYSRGKKCLVQSLISCIHVWTTTCIKPVLFPVVCVAAQGFAHMELNRTVVTKPDYSPEDPAQGCQKQPANTILQDVDGFYGSIAWLYPHQGRQQNDCSLGHDIGSHTPLELLHQPDLASELHLILNCLGFVGVLICSKGQGTSHVAGTQAPE